MNKAYPILLLAALAQAQDVPYYTRGVDKDQDLGGIGQNFRDLADRNLESVGGAGIPGDKCFDSPTLCVDATNHRVGIGTSLPQSALAVDGITVVGGNAPVAGNLFQVGGGSLAVTSTGIITHDGATPTLSACGTSTIYSTSTAHVGEINLVGSPSACTLNFVDAFPQAPTCIGIFINSTTTQRGTSKSASHFTFTWGAGVAAPDTFSYWCFAPK